MVTTNYNVDNVGDIGIMGFSGIAQTTNADSQLVISINLPVYMVRLHVVQTAYNCAMYWEWDDWAGFGPITTYGPWPQDSIGNQTVEINGNTTTITIQFQSPQINCNYYVIAQ